MIPITARHIVLYSKCPKRCQFAWNNIPQQTPLHNATEEIIKLAYLRYSKKNEPTPWRLLLSWTESHWVKVLGEVKTEKDYEKIKGLINKMSNWYSEFYLEKYCDPGLTNVPVTLSLGNNYYYKDSIPLLTTGSNLRIIDFLSLDDKQNPELYNGPKLYNDLLVHTRAWGFRMAAEISAAEYVRFIIGRKSISAPSISLLPKAFNKTDKYIRHILNGIKECAFFPSITSQCLTCPYKEQCSY
jgi:hypothetical protein